MEYVVRNGVAIAVCGGAERLGSVRDILDLLVSASYGTECGAIALMKESLPEAFFDLKTGFAGEILQKFSNYRMRLAVIGDFSAYRSESLRAFIRESNRGRLVFFMDTLEGALEALSKAEQLM